MLTAICNTRNSTGAAAADAADSVITNSRIDSRDEALAEFVQQFPRLFVLTGAGCSTAAGLGDYRDQQGHWKRKQPINGQTFINDRQARQRYWARSSVGWPGFSQAQPTLAHRSLVALQCSGVVRHLVTQNVDELHQRAGHRDVIDLHGVLSVVQCLQCSLSESRDLFQRRLLDDNPWLRTLSAEHAPDGDADLELESTDRLQIPKCQHCAGMLKPAVVFFGENVPRPKVETALSQLESADALMVVGSSLMVYSGFRFCRRAAELSKPIVIVNDGKTRADEMASIKVDGDCGVRLERLLGILNPS